MRVGRFGRFGRRLRSASPPTVCLRRLTPLEPARTLFFETRTLAHPARGLERRTQGAMAAVQVTPGAVTRLRVVMREVEAYERLAERQGI